MRIGFSSVVAPSTVRFGNQFKNNFVSATSYGGALELKFTTEATAQAALEKAKNAGYRVTRDISYVQGSNTGFDYSEDSSAVVSLLVSSGYNFQVSGNTNHKKFLEEELLLQVEEGYFGGEAGGEKYTLKA